MTWVPQTSCSLLFPAHPEVCSFLRHHQKKLPPGLLENSELPPWWDPSILVGMVSIMRLSRKAMLTRVCSERTSPLSKLGRFWPQTRCRRTHFSASSSLASSWSPASFWSHPPSPLPQIHFPVSGNFSPYLHSSLFSIKSLSLFPSQRSVTYISGCQACPAQASGRAESLAILASYSLEEGEREVILKRHKLELFRIGQVALSPLTSSVFN